MPFQVLIAQPHSSSTQFLLNLFREQGHQVRHAPTLAEALSLLEEAQPELVVVDLHSTGQGWSDLLERMQSHFPQTKILFTSAYPDPQQELQAKERYGTPLFLHSPFTRTELEQALARLEHPESKNTPVSPVQVRLPRVRFPVRMKITLPYVLLALVLAAAVAFVVSQVVLDTIEERFTNQLIEAGKLTNDWMVKEEDRLLETQRLLAHTQGVPQAVVAADAERLRTFALPLAINYQVETIELLDTRGASVLSLRHRQGGALEDYSASRGETIFSRWDFVQKVLARQVDNGRDKYAGLAQTPWGDIFYVAGPLVADDGALVGAILVGKSLPTLVQQARQSTLAHTTLYDFNGQPLASTLLEQASLPLNPELVSVVLTRQDKDSLTRPLAIASINYSELVGPWEAREFNVTADAARNNNDLGVIGVAMAETFLARPSQITRLQIFLLTTVALLLIIVLGVYMANRITRPLLQVVEASTKVAQGDLEVQVAATGNDEVTVLAHSFNQMISGLREGSAYRDLLGRTVSPEVREELRRGFASGEVRLQGHETVATILISDIRGFTRLSETAEPTTILTWLNEFFGEMVPLITAQGGVVNQIEGDTMMAFFGVLPRPQRPQESAYQACQAALKMLETTAQLNVRRTDRGEPPFTVGISINTGPVTAGGLGSNDRLHYTIIGDTVNTTTRLESLTRQFGEESSALISQHTLFALRERRHEFQLESLGVHAFRGKAEQLLVYQLQPAPAGIKERSG
ncbi:MAG: HAMP domain-containing protein [Anaerolineales bacterium]|nr:HAMP domain-containing protein [Anaerolineales bacterium]